MFTRFAMNNISFSYKERTMIAAVVMLMATYFMSYKFVFFAPLAVVYIWLPTPGGCPCCWMPEWIITIMIAVVAYIILFVAYCFNEVFALFMCMVLLVGHLVERW